MHLAEPLLYWRIKLPSGKWMYVRAEVDMFGKPLPPEVGESE